MERVSFMASVHVTTHSTTMCCHILLLVLGAGGHGDAGATVADIDGVAALDLGLELNLESLAVLGVGHDLQCGERRGQIEHTGNRDCRKATPSDHI